MVFGGPMTQIVVFLLGAGLLIGMLMIRRALRQGQPGPPDRPGRVCRRCRTVNCDRAKFCANCGLRLR